MDKVISFFKSEPVRAYIYTLVVAVLAALVALGVITAAVVPIVVTLASVVLAVGGVEKVRSLVSPVSKGP